LSTVFLREAYLFRVFTQETFDVKDHDLFLSPQKFDQSSSALWQSLERTGYRSFLEYAPSRSALRHGPISARELCSNIYLDPQNYYACPVSFIWLSGGQASQSCFVISAMVLHPVFAAPSGWLSHASEFAQLNLPDGFEIYSVAI
jgi:hypothetical protein